MFKLNSQDLIFQSSSATMMSLLILSLPILLNSVFGEHVIWPLPREYTTGPSTTTVCDSNFSFTPNIQSETLNAAITRFQTYLENPALILKTKTVQNIISESDAQLCTGSITINSSDETLTIDTNENYTLSVDAYSVNISADTVYGAMFALITLKQLIRYDPFTTKSNVIQSVPWNISDYPVSI